MKGKRLKVKECLAELENYPPQGAVEMKEIILWKYQKKLRLKPMIQKKDELAQSFGYIMQKYFPCRRKCKNVLFSNGIFVRDHGVILWEGR